MASRAYDRTLEQAFAVPNSRWESLHLLRAIASLIVVAHHIPQFLEDHASFEVAPFPPGAAGVDIFFVISGFVMFCTTAHGKGRWNDFLAKRAIRVIPMYWAVTIAMTAAVWILPSAFQHFRVGPEEFVKSLVFLPNYNHAGHIQPVISVGWTLHYELMFYALVALALCWSTRSASLWAAAGVIGLVALAWLLRLPQAYSAWQLLAPIALEFTFGALLAHALHTRPFLRIPTMLRVAASAAAFVLGGALIFATAPYGRDLERVQQWGAGAFGIVLSLTLIEPELARMARFQRCYQSLGDASYSLYLIHLSVFPVVWKLLPRALQASPLTVWSILLLAPVVASVPTHVLVEAKLTRALSGLRRRANAREPIDSPATLP